MKETVNVNIGSQAFTLDQDAYRALRNYLEDIRSRLPEYDTETMGDIESRIATLILILLGGLSIWVYIILWLIVPKAPKRLTE